MTIPRDGRPFSEDACPGGVLGYYWGPVFPVVSRVHLNAVRTTASFIPGRDGFPG
jgi:hypothetical protein